MCGVCGYVEEWIDSPKDIEILRESYGVIGGGIRDPTECLSCGSTIPGGSSKCPDCGWSYKDEQSHE
jgi:hypothetical protein